MPRTKADRPRRIGYWASLGSDNADLTIGPHDAILDRLLCLPLSQCVEPLRDPVAIVWVREPRERFNCRFSVGLANAADAIQPVRPDETVGRQIEFPAADSRDLLRSIEPLFAVTQCSLRCLQGADVEGLLWRLCRGDKNLGH